MTVWKDHLIDEITSWEKWFVEEKFSSGRNSRIENARKKYDRQYRIEFGVGKGDTMLAIDVGSGPISTLRSKGVDFEMDLVCIDPLASEFNNMLASHDLTDLPKIHSIKAEVLTQHFAPASFHLVHCANALDHCENPIDAFCEMTKICRPDGKIVIISRENEGEAESYGGLHQWNLQADDDGFWIWNMEFRQNLLDLTPKGYSYNWRTVSDQQIGSKIFRVEVGNIGR
jgi:ubiquinone/menaquinone biosynthesis C-methylase UbiE